MQIKLKRTNTLNIHTSYLGVRRQLIFPNISVEAEIYCNPCLGKAVSLYGTSSLSGGGKENQSILHPSRLNSVRKRLFHDMVTTLKDVSNLVSAAVFHCPESECCPLLGH